MTVVDESSLRYPGWRVVAACFLVELFIFGFGLYGHAVYLAELQRLYGWPTAVISTASTLSFLLGSVLAAFTADAIAWMGPRRLVLFGMSALAASTTLLAFAQAPWQLYAAYILLSFGWAGMGTVVAATILRAWFDRRSGLAISLAFNGATFGGIVLAPLLVLLVEAVGFTLAMLAATAGMLVLLGPVVIALIRLPAVASERSESREGSARLQTKEELPQWSRGSLLRSVPFWTVCAPFALALLAQVGFIVHQIALLEPAMGRSLAGLAVGVTTAMAVIGRLCLGLAADRIDPRLATAVSLVTQAGALLALTWTSHVPSLFLACAVYGFSIGNLITLPALITQREFESAAFGAVLALSTAVGGVVSALGPGLVGLVRGAAGGYAAALVLCLVLKLLAAAIVLLRPRAAAGVTHPTGS